MPVEFGCPGESPLASVAAMFTTTHALINVAAASAAWGLLLASRPRVRRTALACQDASATG